MSESILSSDGYHRKLLTKSHFRKNLCFIYQGKLYFNLFANVEVLWGTGYYDGLMSGIFYYKNNIYFGRCHQSTVSKSRYYWLYPLTKEEQIHERKRFYIYLSSGYHHLHSKNLHEYYPIYPNNATATLVKLSYENVEPIGYISENLLINRKRNSKINVSEVLSKTSGLPILHKVYQLFKRILTKG